MRLRHLGYVGQNLALGCTTGRTLRLANLHTERLAEVVAANVDTLRIILEWNAQHGIGMFRIASSFVPFASHPSFDFDWLGRFVDELDDVRDRATRHELRLSMHPGQYTVLNSPRPGVVEAALAEVEYAATVLERLSPGRGTITLHVGGAFDDRAAATRRLRDNVARLSDLARSKLTLENDDRIFDVDEVLEVATALEVPMVFDLFHHRLHHRRASAGEALPQLLGDAVATWGGRVPKLHLSSPRDPGGTAHAAFVDDADMAWALSAMDAVTGDGPYDLMLEAKAKDQAVLPHLRHRRAHGAGRRPAPSPTADRPSPTGKYDDP